jgi:hypothetical protein
VTQSKSCRRTRGGVKPKFQKKNHLKTNKVVYDDPATHSCLCCEDYEADCEPTYPCEDFQDIDLWNNGSDGVDNNSNMQRMPCEQIPGQLCRSCDDDECVDRNVTCTTLAIDYQRAVVDFARGDQKPAEVFPGDDDDAVEDNSRIQDPTDARRNSVDVVRENVWCDQKQHLGTIRYSHGMTTCVAKSTWRERRSRDAVSERPSNLSERIARVMELVDDDYPYASSIGTNNNDVDLSDACDEDLGPTSESYDDILGQFIEYLQTSQAVQIPQSRKPDTLQPRVVDSLRYETFIMDENITPLLFNDVNGLWSTLRYGCLEHGGPDVVDCLPCEDQSGTTAESHDFDRVIVEWCCGHDSLLGRTSQYSQGCKVIRLTLDDDLRTLDGLHKALGIAKQCPQDRTLLWSAMPCAGGSPLQRLNKAQGIGAEKLDACWRDFYVLWGNFEIVAKEVIGVGGIVTIEWPETKEYWEQPDVIRFLKKFNFDNSIFRGCACGLVT